MSPTRRLIIAFVPYSAAVWYSGWAGMNGSDVLGIVCLLLLACGLLTIVYIGLLRREVPSWLFAVGVGLLLAAVGLGMGTLSAGEESAGIVGGIIVGIGLLVVLPIAVMRLRRRVRTVFISYRREDSRDVTGEIREYLSELLGPEHVFMDVDSIELGADFREYVADAIRHSDAFLAVIGPNWATVTDKAGGRRLEASQDPVRIEVETALRTPRTVTVPVLVGGAPMPDAELLPESIRELTVRSGVAIPSDGEVHRHISDLVTTLKRGSRVRWRRAAPQPVSWKAIAVMTGILLAPLSWVVLRNAVFATDISIAAASLSPDGSTLLSHHGRTTRAWDPSTGAVRAIIPEDAYASSWSPDGSLVAFGHWRGGLTVRSSEDWSLAYASDSHGSSILEALGWDRSGRYLAAGGWDGWLTIHDLDAGSVIGRAAVFEDGIQRLREIAWSPDARWIAATGSDGTTAVVSASDAGVLHRLGRGTQCERCLSWSRDGRYLAVGSSEEPHLLVWDAARDFRATATPGHPGPAAAVRWSPTEARLASVDDEGIVQIWDANGGDLATFEIIATGLFPGDPELVWSPDGLRLAAARGDRIVVWDVASNRQSNMLEGDDSEYATHLVGWFGEPARLVTWGSRDDRLRVWRVPEGRESRSLGIGVLDSLLDLVLGRRPD